MTNAQKVLPIALSLVALATVGTAPALARTIHRPATQDSHGGGRIGFVVCGAGGRYRPGIRACAAPASAMKNGHCQIQIQPHRAKPGEYRFVERHNYSLSSSAQRGSGG
jgi:hypothetical protein